VGVHKLPLVSILEQVIPFGVQEQKPHNRS